MIVKCIGVSNFASHVRLYGLLVNSVALNLKQDWEVS